MAPGPDRWATVERLYHEALTRPVGGRSAFLADACAGDDALRREVESLLAHNVSADDALGRGAVAAAAGLMSDVGPSALTGRRIGAYHVLAQIGAGGMGEVYRARDTRLGRDVAIKILPREFTSHPDRLARFEREARVLATLNHPHIGAIYGIEDEPCEAGPHIHALVLELIEGETLAERIARRKGAGLPINEALDIARQIADALDAAHEKGIVHRDLKPANIKITPEGVVKVLDFGLAKLDARAVADGATASPTITAGDTREGLIIGTAAYMSPEQARGLAVDKRTDIWAFGCVLYEMLTGRAAFARDTVSDTLAAILEREPEWDVLPAALPAGISGLLRRCLEKDARRRLRDIGDARIALENVGQGEVPNFARSEPTATRNRYLPLIAAGVVLLAGVIAALILGFRKPATPSEVPVRFALPIDGRIVGNPEPSPDGHYVAAGVVDSSGNRRLWVRPIDSDRGRVLEGTDGADGPFWSADARWIGFYAAGRLKKVSPAGGSPQTIAEVPALFGSPTWNAAGDIVYAPINRSGLFRIRDAGGTPQQVTTLDATRMENSHRWPRFLPDGRHFVFTARSTAAANNAVYIGSLDTGETRRLTHVESQVYFTQPPDGATALLFVREGTLFRQPLAGETLTGVPTAIAEHVLHSTIGAEADFAASADGRVLIVREAGAGGRIPTWYRRNGAAIESMVAGQYNEIRLSPDGSHLLFDRPDSDYGNRDVWSTDLSRGTMLRLTNNPANDLEAIWSPDGRRILFASDRAGGPAMNFFSKSAYDISGVETKIEGTPKGQFDLMDISSDGRWIALSPHAPPDTDIWIVPTSNGPKAFPLVETPFAELYPRFSPDGKWIAYSSDDSGRREVYVRPFPARGSDAAAIQVSHVGAEYPVWSADTTELFYLAGDFKMYSVPTRQFGAATPDARPLFTACPSSQPVTGPLSGSVYDVARDGRFLVLCLSPQNSFVVTVNPTSLR